MHRYPFKNSETANGCTIYREFVTDNQLKTWLSTVQPKVEFYGLDDQASGMPAGTVSSETHYVVSQTASWSTHEEDPKSYTTNSDFEYIVLGCLQVSALSAATKGGPDWNSITVVEATDEFICR